MDNPITKRLVPLTDDIALMMKQMKKSASSTSSYNKVEVEIKKEATEAQS